MGDGINHKKIRDSVYGEIAARYVERYGAVLLRELSASKQPADEDAAGAEGNESAEAWVKTEKSEAKPAARDTAGAEGNESAEAWVKTEKSEAKPAVEDGGWDDVASGTATGKTAAVSKIAAGETAAISKTDAGETAGGVTAVGAKMAGAAAADTTAAGITAGGGSEKSDSLSGSEIKAGATPGNNAAAARSEAVKPIVGRRLMTPGYDIDDKILGSIKSERQTKWFYRICVIAGVAICLALAVSAARLPDRIKSVWGLVSAISSIGADTDEVPKQGDGPKVVATSSAVTTKPAANINVNAAGVKEEQDIIPVDFPVKSSYLIVSTVYDSGRTIYFVSGANQDNIVLSLRRGTISGSETAYLTPVTIGGTKVYLSYDADYSVMLYEKDNVVHELTCRFDVNTLIDFCGFEYKGFARGIPEPAVAEGGLRTVKEKPLSAVTLKTETNSYSDIRRHIAGGNIPPPGSVVAEEVVNYFQSAKTRTADASRPAGEEAGEGPFTADYEIGPSPFDEDNAFVFIKVKTPGFDFSAVPASSVTFLINTSSSMYSFDKLPIIKDAILNTTEKAGGGNRISILAYGGSGAGNSVLLDNVKSGEIESIRGVLDNLSVGGYTDGESGIGAAYALARKNILNGGNNIVVAITDENDNLGMESNEELENLIIRNREDGIKLSVFGAGAINTWGGVRLANDGVTGLWDYFHARRLTETGEALLNALTSRAYTAAEVDGAQIEFNPDNVTGYNLIGYNTSPSGNQVKINSKKDAKLVCADNETVLLYELTLAKPYAGLLNGEAETAGTTQNGSVSKFADELFEMRIQYKDPGDAEKKLYYAKAATFADCTDDNSADFYIACSAAAFCELLNGANGLNPTIDLAITLAGEGIGEDADGRRAVYMNLLKQYRNILNQ